MKFLFSFIIVFINLFLFNSFFGVINCLKNIDVPKHVNGSAVNVKVSLSLIDVSAIVLVNMEYRLDYYMVYEWQVEQTFCERYITNLQEHQYMSESLSPGDEIIVSGDETNLFWFPDIYIAEVKKLDIPTLSGRNQLILMKIKNDKSCELRYETRLAATVACQMDFRDYPYDKQICSYRMRSHYYPINLVKYEWSVNGVSLGNPLQLNNYEFSYNYEYYNKTALNGVNYSWLEIDFIFERKLSHFLVQAMAPTLIIILVAYSSCWINVDTGPCRFQLTVGTFLSLVTQFVGLKGQLPPVSYVTALDIWMLICMLFVFAAIIEVAAANYLHKRRVQRTERRTQEKENRIKLLQDISAISTPKIGRKMEDTFKDDCNGKFDVNDNLDRNFLQTIGAKCLMDVLPTNNEPDLALRLDKIFRVCYPVAFIVFNAIFWPFLLNRRLLR